MRRFTPEEDQFIKDHYLSLPASMISRLLGRSKGTARQRMTLLGLTVPEAIKAQFVKDHIFKKGMTPANKGKPIGQWMGKQQQENMKATQFKQGRLPWNTRPKLEVSKRQKRGEKPYLVIFLTTHRPKYLHRYIWEQSNGSIPKGYNIVFKDNNTLNCNLDNLIIMSNAELMRRNSAQRFGPEIFKIIQLRGALNRQINKRLKQLSNEK